MRHCTAGLILIGKSGMVPRLWIIIATLSLILPCGALQADTLWTPYIEINAIHDDNILFEGTDAEEDYVYIVAPGLVLDYEQELTQVTADARAIVRRYQDNDDLDDEAYRFFLKGDSNVTERFRLRGSYKFIKDNTLDSELEDTGRIFVREDRLNHDAMLTPSINLSERTSIGISGRYRAVAYDQSDSADYCVWDIGLPLWFQMETQIDVLYLTPSYTVRESDNSRSTTYNFQVGWEHETTERLTFDLSAGARFSEFEDLETSDTTEDWGGVGSLKLTYKYETGDVTVDFAKGLQNTADNEQVDVSRVICRLRWLFTERMGLDLKGRYYYTSTEGTSDTERTEYIQANPELFYQLTENHVIYIAYEHSVESQKDVESEPRADRNRAWIGIRLEFPL